jgi:hypothetical protein
MTVFFRRKWKWNTSASISNSATNNVSKNVKKNIDTPTLLPGLIRNAAKAQVVCLLNIALTAWSLSRV